MVCVAEPDVARTVRVPFATAVTRPVATPDVVAVTIVESPTTSHTTTGFEIGCPAAFSTVAVSVVVAPKGVSVCAAEGFRLIVAAAFETMTLTESLTAAFAGLTALTFVVPGPLAVIRPSDPTIAIVGSSLVQFAAVRGSAVPAAFWIVTPGRLVSLIDARVIVVGAMSIVVGEFVTVIVDVAETDVPATVAVIVTVPTETAVTRPVAETVAIVASDVAQLNDVETLPPTLFVAEAESWSVPPIDVIDAEVGVTESDTASFRMTSVAVSARRPVAKVPLPVVAMISAVPRPCAVARPAWVTSATLEFLELQVMVCPLLSCVPVALMIAPRAFRKSTLYCSVFEIAVSVSVCR